jgi:hypothetical protein
MRGFVADCVEDGAVMGGRRKERKKKEKKRSMKEEKFKKLPCLLHD